MEFEYLTVAEVETINGLVGDNHLTRQHFPPGLSIGLDSMGPMRDPSTDALFPGIPEALYRFGDTLRNYNLTLIVATNGPDVEGEDILRSLPRPVSAFAVTEGGGKLISISESGGFDYTVLADKEELANLERLEEEVKKHPLMQALLEDSNPEDGFPPIRTPYTTNIVLTLPTTYGVFQDRLSQRGARVEDIDEIDAPNYVEKGLGFAAQTFREIIDRLGLNRQATVIVKSQNRRVYVTPMHIHDGDLNKHDAALFGSKALESPKHGYQLGGYELEHLAYRLENSIYVADKAVDTTGEGQRVISASEKSMILGFHYFSTQPDEGANILNRRPLVEGQELPFMGDVAARLAINITLDDALPRMEFVERVPVLHIGSGAKALEAITYLYRQYHS